MKPAQIFLIAGTLALLSGVGFLYVRWAQQSASNLQPPTAKVTVQVDSPTGSKTDTVVVPLASPAAAAVGPAEPTTPAGRQQPRSWETLIDGRSDPQSIPYGTAVFQYFATVQYSSKQHPADAVGNLRRALDLDDVAANALLKYMDDAMAEEAKYAKQLTEEFCDRRSGLTTIPKLAEALKHIDAKMDAKRESLSEGVRSAVGPDRMYAFKSRVEDRVKPTMTLLLLDHEKFMYQNNTQPEEILARMCGDDQTPQ